MSDVAQRPTTFLELYGLGLVTLEQADDYVSAWHGTGDEEERSLAEYLGMTDEEYGVWVITPRALPAILAARRSGRPLREHVEPFYEQLRAAADPDDAPPIFALSHWLGRPDDDRA